MISAIDKQALRRRPNSSSDTEIMGGPDKPGHDDHQINSELCQATLARSGVASP